MSTTQPTMRAVPAAEPVTKQALVAMKPREQIKHLLEQRKGEIAKMLPKHLNAERLLKVAQIAATTTPALAKCDVPSLVGAIGQCAQMGLEPNTVLGHAYLVPFNTKRKDANGNDKWVNSVQVIIGYKGLIDLARRSGQIISIAAHEVCEQDKFELVYGLDERLTHTPSLGERGEVIGFYSVAKLKDGGHAFEFMSTAQILAIRDKSQGWQQAVKFKKQDNHPWTAHFIEMGRKTVIRRLAKFLPLSIEFQTAAAIDEFAEAGKDQHLESTLDGYYSILGDDAPFVGDEEEGGGSEEETTQRSEQGQEQEQVDTYTGEIITPEPEQDDRYRDMRLVLSECRTVSDISRIVADLTPIQKKDEALMQLIRDRQAEIVREKHG